ncbi:hypothetical protein [Desmospora profundinema]|uniref:Accessory gene regulator protein AgrB n=1 Tax=Desmospora profundinema TaxID=1571184 RepID=A0ABU1IGY2_9BACL|nr:hypothetical protein [Desmospora profundinema]MDR6224036.1 accessory gene regulator protein AgrB [Desmospora profundinema]
MDEMLYLVALVVGIIGGLALWRYAKTERRELIRMIRNRRNKKR